jgi:hypothetical protein
MNLNHLHPTVKQGTEGALISYRLVNGSYGNV